VKGVCLLQCALITRYSNSLSACVCVCVCVCQRFDSGHQRSLTRVLHSLAMVVTASKDGLVRLHNLDVPEPRLLTSLSREASGEGDTLAHGLSAGVVQRIWLATRTVCGRGLGEVSANVADRLLSVGKTRTARW